MSDVYVAELDLATGRRLAEPSPATPRYAGLQLQPRVVVRRTAAPFPFTAQPGASGARAICVRDVESGEVRELASKLNRVVWVRWSPDGRSLLAPASVDGGYPLCRIDVQTGAFECMDLKTLGWEGAWSADGKAIFYCHWDNATKTASIVMRDLATGQEKALHSVAEPSNYFAGVALSL